MTIKTKLSSLPAYQKRVLLILSILLLLYLFIQLIFSFLVGPYVAKELKSKFYGSTRNAYVLEFEDVELGIIGRSLALENVSIYPDSSNLDSTNLWQKVPLRGQFKTAGFSIEGIGVFDLVFGEKLHIQRLVLKKPEILMESIQRDKKEDSDNNESRKSLNRLIYKAVNTHLKSLSVDQFEMTGASVSLWESGKKQGILSLDNAMLQLQDIIVDSASAQREQFFITDKITWSTDSISWNLPNNLYTLKGLRMGGSSLAANAFVDSLRLEPLYPKYEFSKTVGREIDRVDLTVGNISLQKLSYDSLLLSKKLMAGRVEVKGARMEIFHDKRLPGGPTTVKPLPHLSFQEMELPVDIDTLAISDSFIAYSEHKPQVSKPGEVTFEGLDATLTNLTNMSSAQSADNLMQMDIQTEVMGKGLLEASFSFFAGDTSGKHTIYGTLGSMEVRDLNPILEPVGFVRAEDGSINSMKFSMELNKRKAQGTLTLNYRDLKIKLLEKNKIKEGETKDLGSLIANTFVIKKSNDKQPLRNGKIEFERVEEKSVFNYWWKSLLTGLKDTIGL